MLASTTIFSSFAAIVATYVRASIRSAGTGAAYWSAWSRSVRKLLIFETISDETRQVCTDSPIVGGVVNFDFSRPDDEYDDVCYRVGNLLRSDVVHIVIMLSWSSSCTGRALAFLFVEASVGERAHSSNPE